MAIKVTVRQKPISGNRKSLYLDFYPAIPHPETGLPSRREFLKRYIVDKPKTQIDKQHNKEILQFAEQIRQKKENELNKPEIYTGYELEQLKIKEQGERNFVAYFKELTNKRKASNHDNWISALNYLEKFSGGNLKFANLNEKFCNDFKDYLRTTKSNRSTTATLSQNSTVSYFNKLKAALKQAYKDGLLQADLNAKIEPIKPAETHRQYLTIDELNTLIKTDCANPTLKEAALFSALTGLRFSDIEKLTWSEVEYVEGQGYFINFTQQKTKGVEVQPISDQAYQRLGERKQPKDRVFEDLKYSAYQNKHLLKWISKAGINKDITFHCFRHTYATNLLNNGVNMATVSKMLGHRELKTTQIYAKVVDQSKREAANKIQLQFN